MVSLAAWGAHEAHPDFLVDWDETPPLRHLGSASGGNGRIGAAKGGEGKADVYKKMKFNSCIV